MPAPMRPFGAPPGLTGVLLVAGLVLMAGFWLPREPFHFLLPDLKIPPFLASVGAAWTGFLLATASFFLMGREKRWGDLSAFEARTGLLFILLVGALLRLHHFTEYHPTWGWDPFWEIIEIRNVVELGEHSLLFSVGSREPFFTYVLALLWKVIPNASPYIIANVGSTLIDLTAVWVLYLVGRELGGRRTGLIAATLGAFSKPMVIMTLACTRGVSTTLAAALVLLLTLRLFKRSDLRHFLQWGAGIGAAAYTYTGIRPLLLWTLLSVLAAMMTRVETRRGGIAASFLALAGGGWITLIFLERNRFAGPGTPVLGVLLTPMSLGVLGAVAVAAGFLLFRREADRSAPALRGWAVGTALACLLILPLALHPLFANHVMNSSQAFRRSLAEGIPVLLGGWDRTWTHLFMGGWLLDREDMNILRDTYLDLLSIPAVLLGLAALLGRPGRIGLWLLLTAVAGFAPYVLSDDPHSVRLMSGLPAVLGMAAYALDRLWGAFRVAVPSGAAGKVGLFLLSVLVLGGAVAIDGRIWGEFARQVDRGVEIDRVVRDETPDKRIYFVPAGDFFLAHQFTVQREAGRPVYVLKERNPIDLTPEEEVPSIVLFVSLSPDFGDEEARVGFLRRRFPDLPLREIPLRNGKLMGRMEIPASRVASGPEGLFQVRRRPPGNWRRTFLAWDDGLARGNFVSREDLVSRPEAPLPDGLDAQGCRITGRIEMEQDGLLECGVETADRMVLEVAGQKVIDHRAGGRATGKVRLKKGDHSVTIRIHRTSASIPVIPIRIPGDDRPRSLGDIGL